MSFFSIFSRSIITFFSSDKNSNWRLVSVVWVWINCSNALPTVSGKLSRTSTPRMWRMNWINWAFLFLYTCRMDHLFRATNLMRKMARLLFCFWPSTKNEKAKTLNVVSIISLLLYFFVETFHFHLDFSYCSVGYCIPNAQQYFWD